MESNTTKSQHVYVQSHTDTKRVIAIDKSVVDYLDEQHKLAEQSNSDAVHHPPILASGFRTINAPYFPKTESKAIKDNQGILRNFVAIDFSFNDRDHYEQTKEAIIHRLQGDLNAKSIFYPVSIENGNMHFLLIVEVDELLDKHNYPKANEAIIDFIQVVTNNQPKNKKINDYKPNIHYKQAEHIKLTISHPNGVPLNLHDIGFGINAIEVNDDEKNIHVAYRNSHLYGGFNLFLNNAENLLRLENEYYATAFLMSLAKASLTNLIPDEFVEHVLNALDDDDMKENYQDAVERLKRYKEELELVKPLSSYIPIVEYVQKEHSNIQNLAQLLHYLLPADFHPEETATIVDVGKIIHQYFEFALLYGAGTDLQALTLFNPLTGLWIHNEDELTAMMSIIKPGIRPTDIQAVLIYWASKARYSNQIVHPYDKSQYIIFKNGVLDITTMELLSLNSTIVKETYFTERHLLHINYNPNAIKPIVFRNDTTTGGDWTMEQFISAYANFDAQTRDYLLFGLALGLFPGHNSGVHFDIQGSSGSGKSTLSTIYKSLYGHHRVVEILFPKLNEPFPIGNYALSTAVIWIRECNEGVAPLNDNYGTTFYDAMADNNLKIPVKHKEDIIVQNPPQVYIDGTRLIQSDDITSGPARRTLAFKLPDPIDPLRPLFYSNSITERLSDERNLQYLVNEMIKSFKKIVPQNRWTNFTMNLGNSADIQILPKIALDWRQEFMSADHNIRRWFDEMIKTSLYINDYDELLHDEMFYYLYLHWYKSQNPQDANARFAKKQTNFKKALYQIFEEDNLYVVHYKDNTGRNRKQIGSPDNWGMNWSKYDEEYTRPEKLNATSAWVEMYTKRVANFYAIVTEKPNSEEFEELKDGTFKPYGPTKDLKKLKLPQTIEKLNEMGEN